MKLELPLSRKECALAVAHYNSNKKHLSTIEKVGRQVMSFESLESHCNAMAQAGEKVVLLAEGVGRGGEVRINDYKVIGVVNRSVQKGEPIRVVVKRIIPETKSLLLEALN